MVSLLPQNDYKPTPFRRPSKAGTVFYAMWTAFAIHIDAWMRPALVEQDCPMAA
ncbi:MAG: hypothetical protein QGI86_10055 [Candidatus Poribacteria bacterium]|jgi:hypothetical protein|nr:hypothetical protein [Candidatus Poribacteria bacterium]MDP6746858.1 hypothetical protein [Candidatus Poribacteria bacterium]MDP6997129.1 hypothetical protein [Candidatus Poribacteria bacterium]